MIDGVLLVDKPAGMTSFDVVAKARKALATKSVGHTGTLDPFATGLLVLLVGRYTRASNYLLNQDKTYIATMRLGIQTSTDDIEGECIAKCDASHITKAELDIALSAFRGAITQVPPVFSAISIGGERSYKKARRGEAVEMPAREVNVYAIECLSFNNLNAVIKVTVSKGTYIRALARDIGAALGVGAHLIELRRESIGEYHVKDAVTGEHFDASLTASLQHGCSAIKGIKQFRVTNVESVYLKQGKTIVHEVLDGTYLACHDNEPIAFVESKNNHMKALRCF